MDGLPGRAVKAERSITLGGSASWPVPLLSC
jgi:hypothetical protein